MQSQKRAEGDLGTSWWKPDPISHSFHWPLFIRVSPSDYRDPGIFIKASFEFQLGRIQLLSELLMATQTRRTSTKSTGVVRGGPWRVLYSTGSPPSVLWDGTQVKRHLGKHSLKAPIYKKKFHYKSILFHFLMKKVRTKQTWKPFFSCETLLELCLVCTPELVFSTKRSLRESKTIWIETRF